MTERPHRALGEGAAQSAPTAPHATPRGAPGRRTGPERFWSPRRVRIALRVSLAISVALHAALVPVRISSLEVRDVEGEAALPIEVLTSPDIPASQPTSEPPPRSPPPPQDEALPTQPDAAVMHRAPTDAGANGVDAAAAADAGMDASPEMESDAGARNPEALLGAIQPERVLVMLVIDVGAIRANPVGARMGYLVRGIPQWADLLGDTKIEPLRDTDWLVISGPSLINTARDVVLIHYSAPDTLVDRAVLALSRRHPGGGPVDAGVPGVRAILAQADRAERVILRPQSRVLAVVPPSSAHNVARQLRGAKISPPIRSGDAVFFRFVSPHRALPELTDAIQELRARVTPRADGGADVFVEGDTKDAATAVTAADDVARFIHRHDDPITSLVTHGLLDHVEVTADGPLVKAHLIATRDQIATLVALVGDVLGVQPDDLPSPAESIGTPPPLR